MLSVKCRPENSGFWFAISGPPGANYAASYIALGPNGHQAAGRLVGRLASGEWRYQALHFPVMHAALTEFTIEDGARDASSDQWPARVPEIAAAKRLDGAPGVRAESGFETPYLSAAFAAGPYLTKSASVDTPYLAEAFATASPYFAASNFAAGPYLTSLAQEIDGPYLLDKSRDQFGAAARTMAAEDTPYRLG